jgi:uracil-DNA glycosylase
MKTDADRARELAELHAQMRRCRLCLEAGHEIIPPAVFSGGYGARCMVIGQAPGITEQESGRPFNAGSGTRLFQWLGEAGVDEGWFREAQYITTVTKCYPGRSGSGSGDRVPTRSEQKLCRPYLDAEIALIDPALILPVGRLAINLFYPASASLKKTVGTQKAVDGRTVIPLPHPSGASRWHQDEENRVLIRRAVGLIRDVLGELGLRTQGPFAVRP